MTPELLAAGVAGCGIGAAVVFFSWNRMWNDHNKWLDKYPDGTLAYEDSDTEEVILKAVYD